MGIEKATIHGLPLQRRYHHPEDFVGGKSSGTEIGLLSVGVSEMAYLLV
jgi:hypothetical protein